MRSSALLELDDDVLLIDAGPDIAEQLTRARARRIDAVLVTHAHRDAIDGMRWLDECLDAAIPLVSHPRTCARIARRFAGLGHLSMRPVPDGRSTRVGGHVVVPFLVPHSLQPGFPTFGYSFGRQLAYASDVARVPHRAAGVLRGVDTLVLDAAMWFGRRMPAHLSVDAAISVAQRVRAKRLVLTQVGHTFPPHEKAQSEIQRFVARAELDHPTEVRLAYDGMTLAVQ